MAVSCAVRVQKARLMAWLDRKGGGRVLWVDNSFLPFLGPEPSKFCNANGKVSLALPRHMHHDLSRAVVIRWSLGLILTLGAYLSA